MKLLKKISYVLITLILLITIISLFFPTTLNVKRDIEIQAPVATVFHNVNTMEYWGKWGGPWHEAGMDFHKVIQGVEGATSGVGSKLIYDQGKGEGSVLIIESETDKRIKTLITFADTGTANGEWFFEKNNTGTKVTWTLHVNLGYNPLKRIIGNLVIGDKVGPLFDIGLANLKKVSEYII